uniref:Uncharacterized protein n=1 Tax=Romanomermis culicivorax TaxID=13658 RepID=A0A915KM20_ROMCU
MGLLIDALNTLDCQIAELKLRHKRIVEENSALNMQLDDLKVQSEFERNKVALLDENEKKISSDRLKEIDEVANQLQTENTALKVRILDRERQIDQLKMKHAEEIINLQRKTLEKQSHHSCNALNRSHVLDVSAAEHSALNAFVTPRMQSRYGSFQVDANSRTRPEDLYSLRSADSGETFRSVRSADHFFDHNLGCENEPDIMVEHSLTPNNVKNPSKDQTPKVNIVEKQVAISMHLDPLASAFKRPLTPTLKITLEHGISTESIQHQAVTPENSGILTPTENWSRRLTILNRRNNMVLPHLKSFYPTETQILSTEVKENDVRFSNDYKAPEVTVEKTKRKVDDTASKYSSSSPSPTSSSATSKTLKHSAKKSSKFMSVGSKFKRFWREPNTAQNQMPLTPDPTLKDYQMKKSSIAFSIVNSGHKTRKSKKNAAFLPKFKNRS